MQYHTALYKKCVEQTTTKLYNNTQVYNNSTRFSNKCPQFCTTLHHFAQLLRNSTTLYTILYNITFSSYKTVTTFTITLQHFTQLYTNFTKTFTTLYTTFTKLYTTIQHCTQLYKIVHNFTTLYTT